MLFEIKDLRDFRDQPIDIKEVALWMSQVKEGQSCQATFGKFFTNWCVGTFVAMTDGIASKGKGGRHCRESGW
jgi:hypothetical protein